MDGSLKKQRFLRRKKERWLYMGCVLSSSFFAKSPQDKLKEKPGS
jgi:hypothetical protein